MHFYEACRLGKFGWSRAAERRRNRKSAIKSLFLKEKVENCEAIRRSQPRGATFHKWQLETMIRFSEIFLSTI